MRVMMHKSGDLLGYLRVCFPAVYGAAGLRLLCKYGRSGYFRRGFCFYSPVPFGSALPSVSSVTFLNGERSPKNIMQEESQQ